MPAARLDFFLTEDDAQAIALVRAVEETDRAGGLLPLAARRGATVAARAAHGAGDMDRDCDAPWLAGRAGELSALLESEHAFLPRFRRWTSPVRGLLLPAVAVAFVLGLATNALGPEKRINVLAVPLLGLIAWNLAVLALLAVKSWLPVGPAALRAGAPRFVELLEAQARRLIDRLPRRAPEEGESGLLRPALERYLAIWLPAVAPLAACRGRRLLHAASLALILGVVAGMYVRGIAFQYHAAWESTFLRGATVDRFLGTILAPASALLGFPVPTASEIRSTTEATASAAPWIHLWAVTAAIFVCLPRLALVMFEGWRCARRRRRLVISLPDGYVRRLLASADTSQRLLEVVPYSYRPSAKAAEALRQMFYDLFGPRSEIRIRSPLDYGFEPPELEPGGGRLRVMLFGLAQTPEAEVHGELLQHLRDELPDGQALLVLVDGSSYRQRLEGFGGLVERLAERRRAWDRVVRAAGLAVVHVDLTETLPDGVLTRAGGAVWPEGALAGEA